MLGLIGLVPLKDWLYIGAFVVLSIGFGLFVHHEREIGAARVESVRQAEHAHAAAVAASAIAANQTESNRRITATLENVNVTVQHAQAVAADASAAASERDRLRDELAAIRRARAHDPAASGGGSPAVDPTVVLTDVLGRAADRATQLAKLADERATAGDACVRQYDSLMDAK